MTYRASWTIEPNTEQLNVSAEIGNIKYGNMMGSVARSKHHDQAADRIREKHPDAGSYIGRLSIYLAGPREKINSSHVPKFNDGYDQYRQEINIGYRLHDVTHTGMPSAYIFTEAGNALFTGHFYWNKPVNNDKGFQALYFGENGDVTNFAVVDKKGQVKTYALDDELPASVIPVIENIKDATAPSRRLVLQLLSEANGDLEKSFARDLAKECVPG